MGRFRNITQKKSIKNKSKFNISDESIKIIKLEKKKKSNLNLNYIESIITEFFKHNEVKDSKFTEYSVLLLKYLITKCNIGYSISDKDEFKSILKCIKNVNYLVYVTILLNDDHILKKINNEFKSPFPKVDHNDLRPTKFETESIIDNKISQEVFLRDYKDALFTSRNNQEEKDLEKRCEKLIDMCLEQNKNHIVFMDGHGRTLYFLLDFIHKKKLDKQFKLEIVEIEDITHEFHQKFFPISNEKVEIICTKNDIFNITHYSNALYYFNFCGLNNNCVNKNGPTVFKKILDFISKKNNIKIKHMLSFSISHGHGNKEYDDLQKICECFYNVRSKFKTLII